MNLLERLEADKGWWMDPKNFHPIVTPKHRVTVHVDAECRHLDGKLLSELPEVMLRGYKLYIQADHTQAVLTGMTLTGILKQLGSTG